MPVYETYREGMTEGRVLEDGSASGPPTYWRGFGDWYPKRFGALDHGAAVFKTRSGAEFQARLNDLHPSVRAVSLSEVLRGSDDLSDLRFTPDHRRDDISELDRRYA